MPDPINNTFTDTSTKDGQLNSSDSSANPKPSLNNDDKKRLDSIKKELERLKKDAKADAQESPAAVVKPGSLASDSDGGKTGSQDDKSIDKPMMEEEKEKPDAAPSSPPPQKTSKGASLNFLMVLGPLFLVGALGYSFYNLKVKPQTPEAYLAEKGKTQEKYVFQKFPKSPDKITATCGSTGQTLGSDSPASCPDPVFQWQSQAEGFLVYFDTKSPGEENIMPPDKVFQGSKVFKPANLKRGQTYYLTIQEATGPKNPLWISKKTTKTIFKYIYE